MCKVPVQLFCAHLFRREHLQGGTGQLPPVLASTCMTSLPELGVRGEGQKEDNININKVSQFGSEGLFVNS